MHDFQQRCWAAGGTKVQNKQTNLNSNKTVCLWEKKNNKTKQSKPRSVWICYNSSLLFQRSPKELWNLNHTTAESSNILRYLTQTLSTGFGSKYLFAYYVFLFTILTRKPNLLLAKNSGLDPRSAFSVELAHWLALTMSPQYNAPATTENLNELML